MTADRLRQSYECRYLDAEPLRSELKNNPLWYIKDSIFGNLVDEFILGKDTGRPNWQETRMELVQLVAEALRNKEIALGDWPKHKNDDDRWNANIIRMFPEVKKYRESTTDMIIVHHTAMPSPTTLEELNAFQLMSLYIEPFRTTFRIDKEYQPITSGHFSS